MEDIDAITKEMVERSYFSLTKNSGYDWSPSETDAARAILTALAYLVEARFVPDKVLKIIYASCQRQFEYLKQ